MAILNISPLNIPCLIPLLSRSAGFDVAVEDEIDCLRSGAGFGVFESFEDGSPARFVRCYALSSDIRLIEAYPDVSSALLDAFFAASSGRPPQCYRFDLPLDDHARADILRSHGFCREKIFLHYGLNAPDLAAYPSLAVAAPGPNDLAAVRLIMSDIHEYSEEELRRSVESSYWRVLRDGKAIGAAKLRNGPSNDPSAWELVEFAIVPELRSKGLGSRFLAAVLKDLTHREKAQSFCLKVEDCRLAARRCYEKLGFRPIPSKSQRWMYA